MTQLNCVVGNDKCLYSDKTSLIKGDITNFAQKQISSGAKVVLPGAAMLIDTTTANSSEIMIENTDVDSSGALDLDNLLNNKMEEDIKNESQAAEKIDAVKEEIAANEKELQDLTTKVPEAAGSAPAAPELTSIDDLLNSKMQNDEQNAAKADTVNEQNIANMERE
jgi:hypothetical protein